MHQDAAWCTERSQPRGLYVRWGPSPPSPKRGQSPKIFDPLYCDQTAGWIKMALGMEVGLSQDDFVLHGDPVPLPKSGAQPPPQFSAHFYCVQTAACIKMPLGMEVGLIPGDFVFDGDPATPRKNGTPSPPNFWPMSLVAKWLDGSRCNLVRR